MAGDRNKQASADPSTNTEDDLLQVELVNLHETLSEPSMFILLMLRRYEY